MPLSISATLNSSTLFISFTTDTETAGCYVQKCRAFGRKRWMRVIWAML